MPILDLGIQERLEQNRLPEIGRLRKGAEHVEGQAPAEIDYFRFTASEDDGVLVNQFQQLFGTQPKIVPVLMAFPTVEDTFTTWYEEYNNSGFVRMCDGLNVAKNINKEGEVDSFIELPQEKRPICFKKTDTVCKCEARGVLYMIIPPLNRLGTVVLSTTSKTDIFNILESLNYLHNLAVENGVTLRQIPMQLVRYPKQVTAKYTDQQGVVRRTPKTFHFVRVEAHPQWVSRHFRKIYAGITQGDVKPRAAIPENVYDTPPASNNPMLIEAEQTPKTAPAPQVINPEPQPTYQQPATHVEPVAQADRPKKVNYTKLVQLYEQLGLTGDNEMYARVIAKVVLKRTIEPYWMHSASDEDIALVENAVRYVMTIGDNDNILKFLSMTIESLKGGGVKLEDFDIVSGVHIFKSSLQAEEAVQEPARTEDDLPLVDAPEAKDKPAPKSKVKIEEELPF